MPFVKTNDIRTYYERRGTGPPIVFVHGAILDHTQWAPQVAALCGEYTTVAYDVRGHGRTGGSARDAYSVDLFAEDLDALVTALELENPVICGLSTGGCIVQVYAARHPEKISGLVLAGTFTPDLSSPGERLQLALLKATILPVRLVGYERVERVLVWLQERFQPGAGGDYSRIEQLRDEGPKMTADEFAKVVRALTAFPETAVDYSAITAPTLVLYGENEPSFIRGQAGVLAAALEDVSVQEVPGAGHASNLDDPEFFTSAIQDFLNGVETHAT